MTFTDWQHTTTDRLRLDAPSANDVDELHAIFSDPESWRAWPSGRHERREQTEQVVAEHQRLFAKDGLAAWVVREVDGPVVGWGGCSVPQRWPWWNLGYRFSAAVHGRGYGAEMGARAIEAARELAPDRPVLAFLVEHNVGSRRVVVRLGLGVVWRGPYVTNPEPATVRLVYLDREADDEVMSAIEAHALVE